jgi:DNA-binding response OmpR family regulator
MPKILVVDDEQALAEVLEAYLKNEGYQVLLAYDGRSAVDLALSEQPDLVLLDLNLPKLPGLDAFREIRARADIPVIMVTARGEEVDRVVGLELGADDYVAKPYSPREVVARVKSVLRRQRPTSAPAPARPPHDIVRMGDLAIDRTAHEVTRAGAAIKLTPTEYRLLGIFVDHPGQVFARDHLIEMLSNDGGDVFDRTLDRHVANLRSKIEVDVAHPHYVITVYGVGYKMADVT